MSDGEKKPIPAIDLKSRLGAIPKTNQTMNPFGTQTMNPFGAKPSFSLDPKANLANESGTQPSTPAIASPFASPLAGTNTAGLSALGSPLSSPSQPAVANPFSTAPAVPPPSASLASTTNPDNSKSTPFSSTMSSFGSSSFGSSSNVAPQVNANAFSSTPATEAVEEEEEDQAANGWGSLEQADFDPALAQNNTYDFSSSTDYWPKKTVKTMLTITAVVVLIIGLLFGLNISERRNFNYRIESWQNIKSQLDAPFAVLSGIDESVGKILKSKEILWADINKIPATKITPVPTSLLVSKTTLDKDGMQLLSSMVIALNQLFEVTLDYRSFALGMKSELSGNSFEQNSQFGVYAPDFFSSCIKGGKYNCSVPSPGSIGGIVVAITSKEFIVKEGEKYLKAVTKTDRTEREINVNYFISVPKSDVTVGFGGENAINSYSMRLLKVREKLKEVNDIKAKLDTILKERTEQKPIFSL